MEINNKFLEFQQIKYNLFKSQNPQTGRFDVTFEFDGKVLYAHKNMLNLVSDIFDAMLSDRWIVNKDEPIKINEYSYGDFYHFITFLYTAQCQLTDTNIYSMVDIAEFYGVDLFKKYCDEYLSAMEISNDNIFKLIELSDKYSMVQLRNSLHDFITNNFQSFVNCDEFLKVKIYVIKEMATTSKDKIKPEDLFQVVYAWCEKQAMNKQSADTNLNLNDTIKAEISDFIPYFYFDKMDLQFLLKTIVPKSFIFSSLEEFSKILCDCHLQTKVKVTNNQGQTLHGNVIPDKALIEFVKSLKASTCLYYGSYAYCWWDNRYEIPYSPRSLRKRDGVEWFLVFSQNGGIGVQHSSRLSENNYILAEMAAGTSGFLLTNGCKIEME